MVILRNHFAKQMFSLRLQAKDHASPKLQSSNAESYGNRLTPSLSSTKTSASRITTQAVNKRSSGIERCHVPIFERAQTAQFS